MTKHLTILVPPCTNDNLHAVFFPSFCVCLLSPAASQPGVFSLMAVIIDELMFPERANVRSLFFWSLYGIIVNSRMAAFILEPVQFERQGLRACTVSHWLMWGPAQVWRVTDHIPVCDLAASSQSASSEIWSMLSCFTHPFFWWLKSHSNRCEGYVTHGSSGWGSSSVWLFSSQLASCVMA